MRRGRLEAKASPQDEEVCRIGSVRNQGHGRRYTLSAAATATPPSSGQTFPERQQITEELLSTFELADVPYIIRIEGAIQAEARKKQRRRSNAGERCKIVEHASPVSFPAQHKYRT